MHALYRSASDTGVVGGDPIAPRRSERLLALKIKKEEASKADREFGESSNSTVKSNKFDNSKQNKTDKLYEKQTSYRRLKKSQSESDLIPKPQKRRRAVSPEDKQNLSKDKIPRTSTRVTATSSANQQQSNSKRPKSSVSEPLLTSPKGKASGGQDKAKKTSSSKESKTSHKGKSARTSTSGVTTRQLRKLKGRNLATTEMSSDE